ncbi:hypothetical protein L6R52_15120 [Myxococcota bacterium]|nr:hypothetical protein [Myxococcota bacterium]
MLKRALQIFAAASMAGLAWVASCGGPPCRAQDDCPLGYYCVLELGGAGSIGSGQCEFDCLSADDCPQPSDNVSRAICDNEGRCSTIARPPRLILLEPETDTIYPEGTRSIRVSGEVETAAPRVVVSVRSSGGNGCSGGAPREVVVTNPNAGTLARLPFVLDGVVLDPGKSTILVDASIGAAKRATSVEVEVECPGCARLAVLEPGRRATVPALELRHLSGTVDPPTPAVAIWRVFNQSGDVIDGIMDVRAGRFDVERLPLFPGVNRVEVVVTGVGTGLGESRCSVLVTSSVTSEDGLRAILQWNGRSADLDLHVVGPGGHFGDPATSLSSRSPAPFFGGQLYDDAEGYGPEVARVPFPVDGAHGLVVEPIIDGADLGTDALVRVLFRGRPLFSGPVGPRWVTSDAGELWIVGVATLEGGAASWRVIDELVPAARPPVTTPDAWPLYQ